MKNSKVIADINMKESTGLVSFYDVDAGSVKVNKIAIDPKKASQANALHLTACALTAIAGNKDLAAQRVSLLVPDAIAVRCFETLRHKDESAEDISGILFKDWMGRDAKADDYAKAIGEFAASFKSAMAAGVNINFVNARTLYRYELTGDPENVKALADMDEITLTNSVNADLGIAVRQGEFSFANGTYRILRQTRRGANGSYTHYYIGRTVPMVDAEGKRVNMPVAQAAASDLKPYNDAATVLVNVAKFRATAAAYLPKKEVVKEFKVTVA